MGQTGERVSFGGHCFDPATGQLWSGEREVRLTPKAAAVLKALLARAGQPVGKAELFALVWSDTVVGDDALTSCIQELRKALGDHPKRPRFIETRHRRGYRFIAPVALAREEPPQSPGHGGKSTVAVLPFDNMSGDPKQEYLSDGITDDIITALARHRSLLVVARSSTFAFKGRGIDVRRVGVDLGADYVLEGSVGAIGRGRLRIRTHLVETEHGRHVWAERYDRDLKDIFHVQDAITATIAARIEPEVGAAERLRAGRKPPQALQAWDLFHLGMKHFHASTSEDNLEAQRLFRRALEIDPTMAEAHAWLSYAIVLHMVYFDGEADDGRLNEAVAIARTGVELDEQDAVTRFAYGRALLARKAYQEALAELYVAVELNPCLAVVYCGLGDSLAYEGRFDASIPYFEKAIALSPYDPHRWAFFTYRALAHLFARQFDEAAESARKATRVPNCHYWSFAHLVSALGHLQRPDALQAPRAELLQRAPEFSCAFARHRLFYVKNPDHLALYAEGLRRAGIPER